MNWDWSRLLARSAEGRRAIFDEPFMGRWEELIVEVGGLGISDFTEIEAMQILTIFASNWEYLSQDSDDPTSRYHLVVFGLSGTTDRVGVAIVGRLLRPDQIVVTHPVIVRRF